MDAHTLSEKGLAIFVFFSLFSSNALAILFFIQGMDIVDGIESKHGEQPDQSLIQAHTCGREGEHGAKEKKNKTRLALEIACIYEHAHIFNVGARRCLPFEKLRWAHPDL